MKTVFFQPLKGPIDNPYIGFTSFNHFRGEALYSDCIAGKSVGTETENFECYPVPQGVEEKGREQGYHPDTTVAYIRILWKSFEPEQGRYDYAFIQSILDKAREKGQTLMFRLMPHSTCARDDVPDWLKKIMPCPERPDGMRVKDSPTDGRYLQFFAKAIEKLGARFDRDETLDCVDVCLPGAWGEGYKLENYPQEDIEMLMDTFVKAFPNTKLLGQVASSLMINHIGKSRPIGVRGDGTGDPYHMNEYFPRVFNSLEKENWKTAPVSFESYWWVSEWYRQGWDIDDIIEKTLGWHISTFNTKSFPIPYELKDKMEYWLEKMGYRFVVRALVLPESVRAGDTLSLRFTIENRGVAPIYNKLPFTVTLTGKEGALEAQTDVDITNWLPGGKTEEVKLRLPKAMAAGEYKIYCSIGGGEKPTVKLAMQTENDGKNYYLTTIEVEK
ncbi:MAG: DUF4832 domain-containing protein [Clostridia bacterium]|nr:DUF4832 domain-containing protein [Clostridia bacterium]